MKGSRHPILLATVAYAFLVIGYTWPLARHLLHAVPHDAGDPVLNTWILWWNTQAVPLTTNWWNAPIFYPASGTLAFSEHLLGLSLLASPVIWLTHNPQLAYNVALLSTYFVAALGGYALGFTLTRRHDAAFVAGLAFAFAPYRLSQMPHIQVVATGWTAFCLAALHEYDRTPRLRWAMAASGAWLLQGLSNGYFLFFLSVVLAGWVVWFTFVRWPARKLAILAAAWIPSIAIMTPLLLGYQHILRDTYGFSRSLNEIRIFSADVLGLLNASGDLLAWRWLSVWWTPEGELFPGLTVVVLAIAAIVAAGPFAGRQQDGRLVRRARLVIVGLMLAAAVASAIAVWRGPWRFTVGSVRLLSIAKPDKPITMTVLFGLVSLLLLPRVRAAVARRSPLAFYLLAAALTWVFALGPDPLFMGKPVMYQAPYGKLMLLPGFDGFRVPARFWAMSIACLSAIAALAANRLPARHRHVLITIVAAGLLIDGWPHIFPIVPPPEGRPVPRGAVARLELPASDDSAVAGLYHQMSDGIPLYNGYSGYMAPQDFAMRELLRLHDPRILASIASRGPLGVIVDHASDADGATRQFVGGYPGAVLVETHPGWSSYLLPPHPFAPPPEPSGSTIGIKGVDALPSPPHAYRALDGDLKTAWSGGVQTQAASFTIELADPGRVSQLELDLGEFFTDFPQKLRIDVSADGGRWHTVFLGNTMLEAYYGALRHPRLIPLVFTIDRDDVRFLRLQQVGWGEHTWTIAEAHVRR